VRRVHHDVGSSVLKQRRNQSLANPLPAELRANVQTPHAEPVKLARINRQAANPGQFILDIGSQQRLTWAIKAHNSLLPLMGKPFDMVKFFKPCLIPQFAEAGWQSLAYSNN
jgi:hypothetical protein